VAASEDDQNRVLSVRHLNPVVPVLQLLEIAFFRAERVRDEIADRHEHAARDVRIHVRPHRRRIVADQGSAVVQEEHVVDRRPTVREEIEIPQEQEQEEEGDQHRDPKEEDLESRRRRRAHGREREGNAARP